MEPRVIEELADPDEPLWVLDVAGNPVRADIGTWKAWRDAHERGSVGRTTLDSGEFISTEFIGVGDQLWETMVFGLEGGNVIWATYTTRADAEIGHARVVDEVRRIAVGG